MQTLVRIRESLSLGEVAEALGAELAGDPTTTITGVAPIAEAGPADLTFLANKRYARQAASSGAAAILVEPSFEGEIPGALLRIANPYLAFARALGLFFAPSPATPGVHPTAVVPGSCTVADSAEIGPYVVLGEGVVIGADCVLNAHAVVYDGAVLGAGCVLHSHAVVREGVALGARVVVQNGAVVGGDGFGFAPRGDGSYERIPQTGTVVVGDDVDIQAGACIDRAAVGETRIGRGSKIDNLAQVGHGCTIGEDTIICGQVGLAGSCHIGDRTTIAGQVGLAGHLRIGDDIQIAAQSGVAQDILEPGAYGGAPTVPQRQAAAMYIQLTRLPELAKRVKRLERQLADA